MINLQSISKPTRRVFLAGQACALSTAGVAFAQASNPNIPYDIQSPPTWDHAVAKDMSLFLRDRFWARAEDGTTLTLRLVKVEATNSGARRPSFLKRKEGLVATFVSPQLDWFVENGAQTVMIGHPVLGYSDVFISATPKRRGGHELHVVLN